MNDLQRELGNRSTAEKFDLLDTLWESIESSSAEVSSEYIDELDRRMARYRSDPSNVVPWDEARARLTSKH